MRKLLFLLVVFSASLCCAQANLTDGSIVIGKGGSKIGVLTSDPDNCVGQAATGIDKTGDAKGCFTPATGPDPSVFSNLSTDVAKIQTCTNQLLSKVDNAATAGNCVNVTGSHFAVQNPNKVFAGPTSGADTAPAFRALVGADMPATIPATTAFVTNAEYDNGTCTTTKTIAAANGNRQKVLLTDAQTCALSFTQPASGTISITLKITQSSAGAFSGAISGGKWPGGTPPTITQTTGAIDFVSCYLDGTNAYCVASQDFR